MTDRKSKPRETCPICGNPGRVDPGFSDAPESGGITHCSGVILNGEDAFFCPMHVCDSPEEWDRLCADFNAVGHFVLHRPRSDGSDARTDDPESFR